MAKHELPEAEETVEVDVKVEETEVEPEEKAEETKVEVEITEEEAKELQKAKKLVEQQQRIEKVNNRFVQGAKAFGNSVVEDTIIPGAKSIVMEIMQRVAGLIVESVGNALGVKTTTTTINRSVTTGIRKNVRTAKYRNYATTIPERSTLSQGTFRGVRPPEPRQLGFKDKQVASDVLETVISECMEHNSLTMTGFYEIVDNFVDEEIGDYTDWSFSMNGWYPQDFSKAQVMWLANAWYLDIPQPHRI